MMLTNIPEVTVFEVRDPEEWGGTLTFWAHASKMVTQRGRPFQCLVAYFVVLPVRRAGTIVYVN